MTYRDCSKRSSMAMKDKKILITGASRGLGLVAAEALRSEFEVIPYTRERLDFLKMEGWDAVVPEVDIVLHCAGGGMGLRGPYLPARAFCDLFMFNLGGAAEINRI